MFIKELTAEWNNYSRHIYIKNEEQRKEYLDRAEKLVRDYNIEENNIFIPKLRQPKDIEKTFEGFMDYLAEKGIE